MTLDSWKVERKTYDGADVGFGGYVHHGCGSSKSSIAPAAGVLFEQDFGGEVDGCLFRELGQQHRSDCCLQVLGRRRMRELGFRYFDILQFLGGNSYLICGGIECCHCEDMNCKDMSCEDMCCDDRSCKIWLFAE